MKGRYKPSSNSILCASNKVLAGLHRGSSESSLMVYAIWTNISQVFAPGKFFMFFDVCWFSKPIFSQNSFRNTIWVSNRLDPDQTRCFVKPDLGPNCLQRLSVDGLRKQSVTVDGQWPWTLRWTNVYNLTLVKVTALVLIGLSNK